MTYDIKRTNGSVEWLVKTVHPTGTQSKKAMGESVVDMSFTLPVYVDFKINDFVVVYGETYKINLTPSVKKVGKRKFEYQIQFEHLFYDLAKVQLQGLNANNGYLEPVFNLMGNAATIVGLIVENANRHSPGWSVGIIDDTNYQNFSFNAENCLQVLNRLASDFETEFWIENKTIHLQKREQASGLQFEYGQGKGLYSIYRSNKSNINILTRLYVRGGSRNLPPAYRDYATSLLLPGGLTYIQDDAKVNPQTGYGLIEGTIVFENIFPQREGTISAVVAGNDNWDKFTDNSIDFDVNAYKLATPAKVAFNTGQLAGYEFEISDYNHATKQFTIIQNTDEALTVPSNLIRPAVGDKYVLLDIKMPQSYVDAAEAKLLAAAQAYYDKNSDPSLNFAYSVDCDPIWFKQQNVTVVLGNTVVIYDVDLGINGAIRIAGYKRDLQISSKYELEISDSIGASEIVRQYAQQQRTLQLIESYGLLDINQVRKNLFLNRLSENGGYLLLSGNKINAGFADLALNANHANLADYALDADKWDGRQFADYLDQPLRKTDAVKFASVVADTVNSTVYVSGFTGSGYRINPDGSAEFDSLTVRKDLNINVLNVREITGSGGSVAITNVAKIKEVIDNVDHWGCHINTDDGTIAVQLRVNDIVRCQIWDGKRLKFYTARVRAVSAGIFDLDKTGKTGTGIPEAGDTVFQFGNTSDVNRQGLIYLTNSDTGAPYLDVLDGITSDNLTGKTKVRLGKLDGINDADFGQLQGYGLYGQNAYLTNSKFKGIVEVTGGNAATIANVANAKNEAITTATSHAEADATAKASAAQVAAISAAAIDVNNKVGAIKVGGKNILLNSAQYVSSGDYLLCNYYLSEQMIIGEKYTMTIWGTPASGQLWYPHTSEGNQWIGSNFTEVSPNVWVAVFDGVPNTVLFLSIYCPPSATNAIIIKAKLEKGNKPTDWTPAPEDVSEDALAKANAALSSAQTYAAAQAAYEREIAKAYADGKVTVEETARIAQAAANLQAAKDDAQNKVSTALATANGYTDTKALATISAAQTYADNSATSKANAAQANAISQASTDAQNKANAAQAAAVLLSQQLVDGIKVGGKNLLLQSAIPVINANYNIQDYALTETISQGEVCTVTIWGTFGADKNEFLIYNSGGVVSHTSLNNTNEITPGVFQKTFIWRIDGALNTTLNIYAAPYNGTTVTKINKIKLEKGNKATDWTPAPEDVQNAIDNAKALADAANASYATLTANLKSLAYQDVVELAKLGTTIIEGGKIKTTLLDADYIRANVVNAAYINTLSIDATAIKSGTIDSARINASQIISNGGGATVGYVNSSINTATTQAQADATAKASAAQVAAIQAAANDASNKINSLQIGGKNMVLSSDVFFTANGEDLGHFSYSFENDYQLLRGRIVIASVYVEVTNATAANVAMFEPIITFADGTYQDISARKVFSVGESFKGVVTSQAILIADKPISGMLQRSIWIRCGGTNIKVGRPKLEIGNKATDWTPAPEDGFNDATVKANTAQLAAQAYASSQAAYEREVAKAYADGKVTAEEQARIAQASANLQAAKDDATAKVNTAYAAANGYTDSKALETISAAQSYADNSAQSKANVAQANAISQASTDAQNKANQAKTEANLLSQQLVDGIKVGGKNLALNSGARIETNGYHLGTINLSENVDDGTQLTITLWANLANGQQIYIGLSPSTGDMGFATKQGDGSYRLTFIFNKNIAFPNDVRNRLELYNWPNSGNLAGYISKIKVEKGNKATDWTPAPEDVQAAIDNAQTVANAASASYATLTANLKSLAYADVVELAKLGTTIIEGGKIKATLLDADYIRANIVNASYITALDIVAAKVAATQGFIGGFNIVNQSLIAGSNSDNPTAWDLNSSNIRLYTDFQLYRKIGGTADQTDEMAVNLGYYPATSGLSYKDTLVLKNNIRNTAQDYMPPSSLNGSGAFYRQKNRALILEAKNSDENIALEVMSGHVYLRGVNDAGTANALRNGYIKYVNMNGRQVLVLDSNPTELNTGIPDAQGLFWNDAQTGYATRNGCTGYDPQYGYEVGSEHQYTVPAHTYSSTISKAAANSQAATEAQNQAQYEADNFGYCYYQ